MSDDLSMRVAKLEAADQIKALKARYAKACDAGYDPAGMAPLFTEDAVWTDVTGRFGTHTGLRAICDYFAGASRSMSWAAHYIVCPDITVADDLAHAEGTWYLFQACTINGKAVWVIGSYRDEYRKEDETWKMSRLQLTLDAVTPIEEGWVRQPFIDGGHS